VRAAIARAACAAALALAVTGPLAGCGTDDRAGYVGGSSAPAATAPPSASAPSTATTARPDAQQLVNSVCTAVRQGGPAPLHAPFTAGAVQRYADDAAVIARRVEVSLRRMSRQEVGSPELRRLATGFAQLGRAYRVTAVVARDRGAARTAGEQLSAREAAIGEIARQAGFPACAVG
jgi:hypothetical protein